MTSSLILPRLLHPSRGFPFGLPLEALMPAPRASVSDLTVSADQDGATIQLDVPGVAKSDLALEAADGLLTIAGKRAIRGESYAFTRSIEIGDEFDLAQAKAELKDGVLTVTLPRREEAKPKKLAIQVN